MPTEPAPTFPEDMLMLNIARSAWRQRRKLLAVAIAMTVVGIALGWTKQPRWAATAKILPPTDQSSRMPFDLSGLSSLAGVRLGGAGSVDLYPAIFLSDAVLLPVLDSTYKTSDSTSVNLVSEWSHGPSTNKERQRRAALGKLRRLVAVSTDRKSDVVTLVVQSRDAALSAAIANKILDRAESFHQESNARSASSQRLFIDDRLLEISGQLYASEQALLKFRSGNRDILGSPVAQMEHERLVRDVGIQTAIYTELRKQLELAKVEESRTTPIMRVLDRASPPIRPVNSRIRDAGVVSILGTLFFAVLFVGWDIIRGQTSPANCADGNNQ